MPRQIQGSQWNFSAGEVDVSLKRADDHPARKTGARQASNFRILNSGSVQNRSGRRALFPESGRVEKFLIAPGVTFFLVFGNHYLRIYSSAGAQVFSSTLLGDGVTTIPWTSATVKNIVWDIYQNAIYIAYADGFPANVPQILTWNGGTSWTLSTYAELVLGNQKRTPFYRISPKNITMALNGTQVGVPVVMTFSSPVLVAGHVGTRFRYNGAQLLVTSVTTSISGIATQEEPIANGETLTFLAGGISLQQLFAIGEVVRGATTGAQGLVINVPTTLVMVVQLLTQTTFIATENVVGPQGATTNGINNVAGLPPQAITIWDEEVMNPLQGYPSSVSVDQNRLIFSNFPPVPSAIVWSFIGLFTDLYPDPPNATLTPDNAIFELVPGKSQVLYVRPGTESSEFVFCDNAIYYIPISVTNPLKPGSVAFNLLSNDGCAAVQPRLTQDVMIYVNAGGNSMRAIISTGAFLRPFNTTELNEFQSHLFGSVIAIAAPCADTTFEERYLYVLNSDGTMAVGKYNTELGQIKGLVGWVPFSGAGALQFISSQQADVFFTTAYSPNGIAPVSVVEVLDDTQYLDCAIPVQSVPTPFVTALKGPLFAFANGSVTLMDQVTRNMGTYFVDANGFIIPQFNGGEDLTLASLVAGQQWTGILEPFAPSAQSGTDVGSQRMKMRQVSNVAAWFKDSSGFVMAALFSGKQNQTTPALGTIMNQRRIAAYEPSENQALAPTLREWVETFPPTGSTFDPRIAIIKDTPGPLTICEVGFEDSI